MEATAGTTVRVMSKDGARCLVIGTVVAVKGDAVKVYAMGRKWDAKVSQLLPLKGGLS